MKVANTAGFRFECAVPAYLEEQHTVKVHVSKFHLSASFSRAALRYQTSTNRVRSREGGSRARCQLGRVGYNLAHIPFNTLSAP